MEVFGRIPRGRRGDLDGMLEKSVRDLSCREVFRLHDLSDPDEPSERIRRFFGAGPGPFLQVAREHDPAFLPAYGRAFEKFLEGRVVVDRTAAPDVEFVGVPPPSNRTFFLGDGETMVLPVDCRAYVEGDPRFVLDVVEEDGHRERRALTRVFLAAGSEFAGAGAILDEIDRLADALNPLKGRFLGGDLKPMDRPKASWGDIVLEDAVRERVLAATEGLIRRYPVFRRLGVPLRRGIILEGPPGVGKTLTGRILASTLRDAAFVWVTPKDIERPADVSLLFKRARALKPAIVFLEDAEIFLEDRDDGERSDPKVLGEFLVQMDGLVENDGVITIITTNRADRLEKAIRDRPGRFDCRVAYAPPGPDQRRGILMAAFAGTALETVALEPVVRDTGGFSGAQVKELALRAKMRAVERMGAADGVLRVGPEDLLEALESMKPVEKRLGFAKPDHPDPPSAETDPPDLRREIDGCIRQGKGA